MFAFLGIFFVLFGIGALAGLAYAAVKMGPWLFTVIVGGSIDVLRTWFRAAKKGWEDGDRRFQEKYGDRLPAKNQGKGS